MKRIEVLEFPKTLGTVLPLLLILAIFSSKGAIPDYVEGLDTTDVNGYSPDSTFAANSIGIIRAAHGIFYYSGGSGFFHYSFDDIKMAYQGNYGSFGGLPTSVCFVIRRTDSTYSKFQVLRKLASGQYEYRFGTNMIPNDRMLEKADYDRSVRYKPNNARFNYQYLGCDTIFWDTPLPNDNHLLGYEIYRTKIGAIIDTAGPINLDQWDSVAFVDSSKRSVFISPTDRFYQNIVAVYTEGKSDFLQGWTQFVPAVGIKELLPSTQKTRSGIALEKTPNGYSINLNSLAGHANPLSVTIYDLSGQKVLMSTVSKGNRLLLNTAAPKVLDGLYLVNVKLSDETVLSQKVMISR